MSVTSRRAPCQTNPSYAHLHMEYTDPASTPDQVPHHSLSTEPFPTIRLPSRTAHRIPVRRCQSNAHANQSEWTQRCLHKHASNDLSKCRAKQSTDLSVVRDIENQSFSSEKYPTMRGLPQRPSSCILEIPLGCTYLSSVRDSAVAGQIMSILRR